MDSLWKKETNGVESLYVDIFKDIDRSVRNSDKQIESINLSAKKDNKLSNEIRKEADTKLTKNDFFGAMELYNKSLCFAEFDSENVSLAYASRSACFFRLKMIEKCAMDIDLAKRGKLPKYLQLKLENRLADCLKQMEIEGRPKEFAPELSFPADESFPEIANVLKIRSNAKFGRHIIAKCDIDVGKTVLIEEPIAFQMKQTTSNVNFNMCSVCLRNSMNFVACKHCTSTLFCDRCIKSEGKNIHRMECGNELARKYQKWLRCLSAAAEMFENTEELIAFIEDASTDRSKEAPQQFFDNLSKYREFLKLNICTRRDAVDILNETFIVYNYILSEKPFHFIFGTEREQRFLMHWIVHHSLIFESNSFGETISECAFVVASYFNHSCAPNLIITHSGHRLITAITARPVKKGQQLFVNYIGTNFQTLSANYRQTVLWESYGFLCQCEKCENSLPDSNAAVKRDHEFSFSVSAIKTDDRKELLKLRKKCVAFLMKFNNNPWNHRLEQGVNTFWRLTSRIQNQGYFSDVLKKKEIN